MKHNCKAATFLRSCSKRRIHGQDLNPSPLSKQDRGPTNPVTGDHTHPPTRTHPRGPFLLHCFPPQQVVSSWRTYSLDVYMCMCVCVYSTRIHSCPGEATSYRSGATRRRNTDWHLQSSVAS
eukprot:scpid97803/ scgid33351/ 